jgi:ABC-2 type transport system ATP-binding protein
MLEAIKLSKSYNGTVALDSLDLKIEPGEVFCLLGANGAGKTNRPPARLRSKGWT